jgi:hypothetical protein
MTTTELPRWMRTDTHAGTTTPTCTLCRWKGRPTTQPKADAAARRHATRRRHRRHADAYSAMEWSWR